MAKQKNFSWLIFRENDVWNWKIILEVAYTWLLDLYLYNGMHGVICPVCAWVVGTLVVCFGGFLHLVQEVKCCLNCFKVCWLTYFSPLLCCQCVLCYCLHAWLILPIRMDAVRLYIDLMSSLSSCHCHCLFKSHNCQTATTGSLNKKMHVIRSG